MNTGAGAEVLELSGDLLWGLDLELSVTAQGGAIIEDRDLLVALIGEVNLVQPDLRAPTAPQSAGQIHALYLQRGPALIAGLSGLFTAVVQDRRRGRLLLFQDPYSSPLHLYYASTARGFFFSTSLKRLLASSAVPRSFEPEALETFLYSGFVPWSQTLLRQVSKLVPQRYLELDMRTRGHQLLRHPPRQRQVGFFQALQGYYPALCEAVGHQLERHPEAELLLSGGFDSNLLLQIARSQTSRPLTVHSIGGRRGIDESPQARAIVQHYRDVSLQVAHVEPETLQAYPDIVWRLEGAVYEAGIFLQHKLGQHLAAHGARTLLSGELADQIHTDRWRRPMRRRQRRVLWRKHRYESGLMMVLKKSGIMTNSWSLRFLYPYLHDNVVDTAARLALINGNAKRFQKYTARRRVPAAVAALLGKEGGRTSESALFEDDRAYLELESWLRGTPCGRHLQRRYLNPGKDKLRWRMDLGLRVLYLLLFERLFISGAYDHRFAEVGFTIELDRLLQR